MNCAPDAAENALRIFGELREAQPPLPALAEGLIEFAQLELDNRHFDEALAILEDARALHPEPALLERIEFPRRSRALRRQAFRGSGANVRNRGAYFTPFRS